MADRTLRVALKQLAAISDNKHLVTKEYVDARLAGQIWDPVRAATVSGLAVSTTSATVLTSSAQETMPAVDGVTLAAGDRVLLKDQSDKTQNGIYEVTSTGGASAEWVLTRADDADAAVEFRPLKAVYTMEGTVNDNAMWKLVSEGPYTIGGTNLEFALAADSGYARAETVDMGYNVSHPNNHTFDLVHTLGTANVSVSVKNVTSGALEDFGVTVLSNASVRIFADPPLTGADAAYEVTIIGQA
jgi:hypothetical protein